jgi:hypothetical protein
LFERIDANADGVVDTNEFQAAGEAYFARRDADGDGYVDRAEFGAPHARPPGAQELTDAQKQKRAQWRDRIFAMIDGDDDGQVSAAEAAAARARMFDRLDADGDGQIARDEVRRHGPRRPLRDTSENR